jgi:predicted DNA-binding helix-hairpin-helix protein
MGRMVAVAETLRRRYGFRGYIHLKVLPGSSRASIEAAGRVADRISVNLEAPSAARLACLAPDKDWTTDLRRRMEWVAEVVKDPAYRARSHTTQFVVGAGGESDRELLRCVWDCYRGVGLDRAYFSAYQPPDRDAPAPATAANLLTREHRLYQADWLVRRYGFAFDELPFDPAGGLDPVKDPKQVWADRHPDFFPVEVNRAEYGALLRVPGIGPTGASRIVKERRAGALRRVADLARLGVVTQRAAAYVLLDGRQPLSGPRQQTLWAS